MERSDQLDASAVLPQGKNLWYPLVRKLDGTPEPVWKLWRREKFYTAVQPLARSLYRLSYPG
jgi:hypothetical protein